MTASMCSHRVEPKDSPGNIVLSCGCAVVLVVAIAILLSNGPYANIELCRTSDLSSEKKKSKTFLENSIF